MSATTLAGTTAQVVSDGWAVQVVGDSSLAARVVPSEVEVVVQDGGTWTVVRLDG